MISSPNYCETRVISQAWVNDPARVWTVSELVGIADPTGTNDLPASTGYHYSNTNYLLAVMIAEQAAGQSYRALVRERVIEAFGLDSLFYEPGAYPAAVIARLAHSYFDNPACADYQPECGQSWNQPLMGKDVRAIGTSWAQAAGGALANARDVDCWMRAIFEGHVVPARQQAEWMALVSNRTVKPIDDVSADDPRGFALGPGKAILGPIGAQWFYRVGRIRRPAPSAGPADAARRAGRPRRTVRTAWPSWCRRVPRRR